jgi:hypothetical protein
VGVERWQPGSVFVGDQQHQRRTSWPDANNKRFFFLAMCVNVPTDGHRCGRAEAGLAVAEITTLQNERCGACSYLRFSLWRLWVKCSCSHLLNFIVVSCCIRSTSRANQYAVFGRRWNLLRPSQKTHQRLSSSPVYFQRILLKSATI